LSLTSRTLAVSNSATSLQGANFPTSVAGDGHPGGEPAASLTTGRTSLSSTSTKAGRDGHVDDAEPTPEQAARRADADFAPTSENEPSTGDPAAQEKPSVKEKLKGPSGCSRADLLSMLLTTPLCPLCRAAGLNKVIHPKSGKAGGEDEAIAEPSYRELYDKTVTLKMDESTLAERHLTADEVARDAATIRRSHGPGVSDP
jgi:hypothetical protein